MEKPDFRQYPNTQEGIDAYDSAVAAYEREQNPLIGKEFVDTVENVAGQVSQIPIIKQGLQFLGGTAKLIDETMTQDQGMGGQLYRSYQTLKSTSEQQFSNLAESIGVDPRIGSFVGGEVIDTLATAGTASIARKAASLVDTLPPGGMSPRLVTAHGGIQLSTPQPAKGGPVFYAEPRPGSRGRYLTQDEFDVVQPQRVRDARDTLDEAQEIVQNIEEANIGIPKKVLKKDKESGYKSAVRKKEDQMANLSSEESNILTPTPDNQYAFPRDSARAREIKAQVFKENNELGRAIEQLEMHHLFPKGISAAIYNRVRDFIEVGDAVPGDLTRIARKLKKVTGLDTGDLESNIKAMRKTPHGTFHNEMRYQPSDTFKGQKLEISKEKLATELRKVKNLKDLEVLLDTFLEKDIIPLIENAKIWENMDDAIKSVSPKYTGKAKYKP